MIKNSIQSFLFIGAFMRRFFCFLGVSFCVFLIPILSMADHFDDQNMLASQGDADANVWLAKYYEDAEILSNKDHAKIIKFYKKQIEI